MRMLPEVDPLTELILLAEEISEIAVEAQTRKTPELDKKMNDLMERRDILERRIKKLNKRKKK